MTYQNTIILNGKLYDSATGVPLSHAKTAPQHNKPNRKTARSSAANTKQDSKTKTIDGFIGRRTSRIHLKNEPTNDNTQKNKTHPLANDARTIHHRKVQSKTLMRQIVSKPTARSHKSTTVAVSETTNKDREQRANKITKSELITRFHNIESPSVEKRLEPIEVAVPPILSHSHNSSRTGNSMFDEALANATSHRQASPQKGAKIHHSNHKSSKNDRILGISSVIITAVLLIGFVVLQNKSNLTMRVASSRSGVAGSLPSYLPSGYKQAPITYHSGQISLNFESYSDNRSFTITQRNSKWSNDELIRNYLDKNNLSYHTHKAEDNEIYVYDNTNATWLSRGIWYSIESQSTLSNDQLLKIAASL